MIQRLWQPLQCDDAKVDALVQELGVAPLTARLLCIRGISDLDEARRFLSPSLDDLLDPFALTDMAVAVDRILATRVSDKAYDLLLAGQSGLLAGLSGFAVRAVPLSSVVGQEKRVTPEYYRLAQLFG